MGRYDIPVLNRVPSPHRLFQNSTFRRRCGDGLKQLPYFLKQINCQRLSQINIQTTGTRGLHSVVGKMTTFDLWPIPLGGGAWGAGTNMWHPETPASYESLPDPLATQIPTLWIHTSVGRGRGGALILDRWRAFDLCASVDAHLWLHWSLIMSPG